MTVNVDKVFIAKLISMYEKLCEQTIIVTYDDNSGFHVSEHPTVERTIVLNIDPSFPVMKTEGDLITFTKHEGFHPLFKSSFSQARRWTEKIEEEYKKQGIEIPSVSLFALVNVLDDQRIEENGARIWQGLRRRFKQLRPRLMQVEAHNLPAICMAARAERPDMVRPEHMDIYNKCVVALDDVGGKSFDAVIALATRLVVEYIDHIKILTKIRFEDVLDQDVKISINNPFGSQHVVELPMPNEGGDSSDQQSEPNNNNSESDTGNNSSEQDETDGKSEEESTSSQNSTNQSHDTGEGDVNDIINSLPTVSFGDPADNQDGEAITTNDNVIEANVVDPAQIYPQNYVSHESPVVSVEEAFKGEMNKQLELSDDEKARLSQINDPKIGIQDTKRIDNAMDLDKIAETLANAEHEFKEDLRHIEEILKSSGEEPKTDAMYEVVNDLSYFVCAVDPVEPYPDYQQLNDTFARMQLQSRRSKTMSAYGDSIDIGAYLNFKVDRSNNKVFNRRNTKAGQSIVIMLDGSASMDGWKMQCARRTCKSLDMSLKNIHGVDLHTYVYTGNTLPEGGKMRTVTPIVEMTLRNGAIDMVKASHWTHTNDAVRYVISQSIYSNKKRMLIIVTDGYPATADEYGQKDVMFNNVQMPRISADTAMAIDQARKEGWKVVTIFIDSTPNILSAVIFGEPFVMVNNEEDVIGRLTQFFTEEVSRFLRS